MQFCRVAIFSIHDAHYSGAHGCFSLEFQFNDISVLSHSSSIFVFVYILNAFPLFKQFLMEVCFQNVCSESGGERHLDSVHPRLRGEQSLLQGDCREESCHATEEYSDAKVPREELLPSPGLAQCHSLERTSPGPCLSPRLGRYRRTFPRPALVCDTEAPSLIMLARTIIYFMQ